MKNVLHNFFGGGEEKGGVVEPRPGRFQVSPFLPTATASYDWTGVWKTKKSNEEERVYRCKTATRNNLKQTKLAGCV